MTDTILVADVGATHTRLAVGEAGGAPQQLRVIENRGRSGLPELLREYLSAASKPAPTRAVLAVAGPVENNAVALTNLEWRLDGAQLARELDFASVRLENDFMALAAALPYLEDADCVRIGGADPLPNAAKAVLGPGSGLGVAGLVPTPHGWWPVAGEGGHVTLPPRDEHEAEILADLREGHWHVSAERVLSGPGLVNVYRAIAHRRAVEIPKTITPAEIVEHAHGKDAIARETLNMFFSMLGTVAGDVALTFGARGGVYLGGGILPRVRQMLLRSHFRERFEAKGRLQPYVARIPVYLITAEAPALKGLLALAKQP
jgi:glucokinase